MNKKKISTKMVRLDKKIALVVGSFAISGVSAWSTGSVGSISRLSRKEGRLPIQKNEFRFSSSTPSLSTATQLKMMPVVNIDEVVSSSTTTVSAIGSQPVMAALAAYGHYLSFMIITACLVVERLTVKANMSDEEENRLVIADSVLGISGLTLVLSGYYRATLFEKGWDFYSHEPVFWFKMVLVSVFGAMSFFPTTKIIQRAIAKRNGNLVPMSEKLAKRMTSLLNAELLALFTIPASATFMARGVAYNESIPWQAEAALVPLVLIGLGGKYIKEALDFEE